MSANIFDERFLARDKPAWWDYEGNHTFPEDRELTTTEAVSEAGLDYQMFKEPNYVRIGGQEMATGYYSVAREPVGDEDQPVIFRGQVSDSYGLLQNMDIAKVLEEISEEWPVETVGAIGDGERMFIVLDAGEAEVGPASDEVTGYYLVTDDKTGGGKLTAAFTPTRVVCMNTLRIGLSSANVKIDLEHSSNVQEELELTHNLMADLRRGEQNSYEAFDALARTDLTPEEKSRVIEDAYPLPEPTGKVENMRRLKSQGLSNLSSAEAELVRSTLENFERRRQAQQDLRDEAFDRLTAFEDRNSEIAGTAWAAYNAVAENESWRSSTNDSIRARGVLLGDRSRTIKQGFDAAFEMAA